MKPMIRVRFDKPVPDGNLRLTTLPFIFSVEGSTHHPGPGHWIRWGCFSANFWFTSGSGKSWKQAAHFARLRIRGFLAHRQEGYSVTTTEEATL